MTVKLHVFKLPGGYEYGHLYSDHPEPGWRELELCIIARDVSPIFETERWIQRKDGFLHFDLWGKPLRKAKKLSNDEDYNLILVSGRTAVRDKKKMEVKNESR